MEERFVISYEREAFVDRLLADLAFLGEMSSVAVLTEVISIMFLESLSRKRLKAQGTDKTLGVEDFTIIFYPGRLDALVAMVTNLAKINWKFSFRELVGIGSNHGQVSFLLSFSLNLLLPGEVRQYLAKYQTHLQ